MKNKRLFYYTVKSKWKNRPNQIIVRLRLVQCDSSKKQRRRRNWWWWL